MDRDTLFDDYLTPQLGGDGSSQQQADFTPGSQPSAFNGFASQQQQPPLEHPQDKEIEKVQDLFHFHLLHPSPSPNGILSTWSLL